MDIFTLCGRIVVDNSAANSAIGETAGQAESSSNTMVSAFKKIGAAIATYLTVDTIKDFGVACVEAAASIQAQTAQFEATFGDMQGAAQEAFEAVGSETGILATRLQTEGTKAFSMFKGAGMDANTALEEMETFTRLAADAAAYYDISLEEASAKVLGFAKGNFENGDAIGVFTNEAQRNAIAMEQYGKTFSECTEAQKQMMALDMIESTYEMSGALGQASREADGYENVMGNLKEAWRQFQGVVGAPILQAVIPVIQKLTDGISGMGDIASQIGDAYVAFLEPIMELGAALAPILLELANILLSVLGSVLSTFVPTITQIVQTILPRLLEILTPILELIQPILDLLQPTLDMIVAFLEPIMMLVEAVLPPLVEALTTVISSLLPVLMEGMQYNCDFLKEYVIPLIQAIIEVITPVIQDIIKSVQVALEGIINIISGFFDIIMGTVNFWMALFQGDWEGAWEAAKQVLSGILDIIIGILQSSFSGFIVSFEKYGEKIKSFFLGIGSWISETVKNCFNKISEIATTIFTNIKNFFVNAWDTIIDDTKARILLMQTVITNIFSTVVDTVKSLIEKLKGFFNFEWKLPNIKLPHFQISPSGWKIGDLLEGEIPKLGIEWYAKGGILTKPTVFGVNGSKIMAGGEAGDEAVAPIETLRAYVEESVASQNQPLIEVLIQILNAITQCDNDMLDKMVTALESMRLEINEREFGRLVRKVQVI